MLANEQVNQGLCWRCDSKVEDKDLEQWFVKITDYAEELLSGHKQLEKGWPQEVLAMQKNWIGKSTGAELDFEIESEDKAFKSKVRVFTTRPDTLFGATFMVFAPEHKIVERRRRKLKILNRQRAIYRKAEKNQLSKGHLKRKKQALSLKAYML